VWPPPAGSCPVPSGPARSRGSRPIPCRPAAGVGSRGAFRAPGIPAPRSGSAGSGRFLAPKRRSCACPVPPFPRLPNRPRSSPRGGAWGWPGRRRGGSAGARRCTAVPRSRSLTWAAAGVRENPHSCRGRIQVASGSIRASTRKWRPAVQVRAAPTPGPPSPGWRPPGTRGAAQVWAEFGRTCIFCPKAVDFV
jgi:hypothetical protein